MRRTSRYLLLALLAVAFAGELASPAFSRNVRTQSRGNVHSNRSTNVNRNRNVNVNHNVNVNNNVHVDVNHGGYYGGGCCYHEYHPVATVAAVAVTAAVVGSIVASIPPSCTTVIVNGFGYQQCGNTWYQPQLSGTSTTYVVVAAPR